jgi:hypothetical protein
MAMIDWSCTEIVGGVDGPRVGAGALSRAGTQSTALSQHCLCGARVPKTLAQRTHRCPECGLHADRDITSAMLAACVELTDPDNPRTARVNYRLAHALRAGLASQQEWEGSVNRHQPPPSPDGGSARTGSHHPVASAEQAALGPPPNRQTQTWTSRDQPKTTSPQADWRCMTHTGQLLVSASSPQRPDPRRCGRCARTVYGSNPAPRGAGERRAGWP